jgi:hypothetical protein
LPSVLRSNARTVGTGRRRPGSGIKPGADPKSFLVPDICGLSTSTLGFGPRSCVLSHLVELE